MGEESARATPAVLTNVVTIPNVISALRLVLVGVFAVLVAYRLDVWAVVVLAVSGATDWLDGYLARKLGQVSRLGQMLDPAADRLFILVTLIALTARDIVPLWVTFAVIGRDVLLGVVVLVLARHGYGPLPVNFVGKAGTFALLYALPLLLLATVSGWVGHLAAILGWAFAWWGVGLYWLAGLIYLRQASEVLRADAAQ